MKDAAARVARTLIQLVAAGVLTELTRQVAGDLPAAYAPYVMIVYTVLVTACQNYAEEAGWLKPVLKPRPEDVSA